MRDFDVVHASPEKTSQLRVYLRVRIPYLLTFMRANGFTITVLFTERFPHIAGTSLPSPNTVFTVCPPQRQGEGRL